MGPSQSKTKESNWNLSSGFLIMCVNTHNISSDECVCVCAYFILNPVDMLLNPSRSLTF